MACWRRAGSSPRPRTTPTSERTERMPIAPYGGTLVDLRPDADEAAELRRRARSLPRIRVSAVTLSDLYLLAVVELSPLAGFMGRRTTTRCWRSWRWRTASPGASPSPFPPRAPRPPGCGRRPGGRCGCPTAGRRHRRPVSDKFGRDSEARGARGLRTTDGAHPGVAADLRQGDRCRRRRGDASSDLPERAEFPQYRLRPPRRASEFARRGWKTVVGFQTRNPIHRAHEYIQKCALEIRGRPAAPPARRRRPRRDDIPADVRMRCYEVLLENYYPADRVVLAVYPAAMRYAGPREAIFHALVPQELRLHPLHRRPRPRRRRQLLRHLRRAEDLRPVRAASWGSRRSSSSTPSSAGGAQWPPPGPARTAARARRAAGHRVREIRAPPATARASSAPRGGRRPDRGRGGGAAAGMTESAEVRKCESAKVRECGSAGGLWCASAAGCPLRPA